MRVAAYMSGSGTNIIKLLDREKMLKDKEGSSPFQVIFIFSDRSDGACRGEKIACENGIPYFSYDIRTFHKKKGVKRTALTLEGLAARKEFDKTAAILNKAFDIDIIALGGYMSYITLDRCINVHPADLSVVDSEGKRLYVGDNAVLDAIIAGEKTLRSSTLLTDKGVDTGPLLMVSDPLDVILPEPLDSLKKYPERLKEIAAQNQERLKQVGDWEIFPLTIEMIARGRFALDENNKVYVDGEPALNGTER
jgi:folate-dependent phosphoribosylglycinamide formyltransferase PurN